ncbi:hypothetical protein [Burkholderia alba]|uniref:hypothetical protein n=1 Tax=Burkholderia alba TaxID=2683677 RepID=UPI002B05A74B|nr:hypothetical protein [Burkholderia alba]
MTRRYPAGQPGSERIAVVDPRGQLAGRGRRAPRACDPKHRGAISISIDVMRFCIPPVASDLSFDLVGLVRIEMPEVREARLPPGRSSFGICCFLRASECRSACVAYSRLDDDRSAALPLKVDVGMSSVEMMFVP